MKHFHERLRWLRERVSREAGRDGVMSLEEFGGHIDFGRSYLSRLEGKKADPPPADSEFWANMSRAYGVRREWLEFGDGEPFADEKTFQETVQETFQKTDGGREPLMEAYGAEDAEVFGMPLSEDQKLVLVNFVRELSDEQVRKKILDHLKDENDRVRFATAHLLIEVLEARTHRRLGNGG